MAKRSFPTAGGLLLSLGLLLGGCGGGGGSGGGTTPVATTPPPALPPAANSQCTLTEAKTEILDLFEQLYLYNEPTYPGQQEKYATAAANLAAYPTVDALLDYLRYESGSYDRGFTYYLTVEEVDQFYRDAEFVGFGFSVAVDSTNAWRLIDVYTSSAAGAAGWQRGYTILSVDGVPTAQLDLFDPDTFGDAVAGVTRTFAVRDNAGTTSTVTLSKGIVDIEPVPADRIRTFDLGGRRIGYVFFRTFVQDADAQLRSAVAGLVADGVDEVIVDLRYNGGGLVSTAEVLGGLLAGPDRAGALFYEYRFNSSVANQYDEARFFPLEADGFPLLQNLVFITDGRSASASELSINGLKPYVPTATIGERTFGKPVGQWGLQYCNDSMVLFLVTFRTLNADGEGDYYDGLPADCSAPDDWDHLLGDPDEARLKAALDYLESGGSLCTPPATLGTASLRGGAIVDLNRGQERGATLAARLLNAF
ncbi:MAG: S41 family peptidase [Pseudomonadales bacterium]